MQDPQTKHADVSAPADDLHERAERAIAKARKLKEDRNKLRRGSPFKPADDTDQSDA